MKNSVPNVGTSSKPAAIINPDGKSVFLAWKGEGNDKGIYWTKTHEVAPNAATGEYKFYAQTQMMNVATTHGPALVSYKGKVYMAWKGEADDKAIYWSQYDGSAWQPQKKTEAMTEIAPALVATKDAIFLVWQGMTDRKIWWAIMEDIFDGPNDFTVAGALKVGSTFFETSATPSLAADGNTVYMGWKGASTGTLHWAKCVEHQSVVTGNLPPAEGINAWQNYFWSNQESIPTYQNDAGDASVPGMTIGIVTGTGAGPTISGPALVFIKGTYSSGLYLAWVTQALNVNTAEWGPSYSYLSFAFRTLDSTTWIAADNSNMGDSADLEPTFISVFEPYIRGGINTPIYFFKGIGDDWNIYYDSCLMFDSFQPSPQMAVARGSFPPGYAPNGSLSVPAA